MPISFSRCGPQTISNQQNHDLSWSSLSCSYELHLCAINLSIATSEVMDEWPSLPKLYSTWPNIPHLTYFCPYHLNIWNWQLFLSNNMKYLYQRRRNMDSVKELWSRVTIMLIYPKLPMPTPHSQFSSISGRFMKVEPAISLIMLKKTNPLFLQNLTYIIPHIIH